MVIMFTKRAVGLFVSGLIVAVSTASAANASEAKQSAAMQYEYSKIKELVERIEKFNYLGNYPLTFTIVNGDYGGWIAEELRLCKEDECSYYANLNPFGFNNRKEREIVRQSYLYSDIQGSAYTNGTITFSTNHPAAQLTGSKIKPKTIKANIIQYIQNYFAESDFGEKSP